MNVRGVALFFIGWFGLSIVAGVAAGKVLARAGRHPSPAPPPRAAVEPAPDVSPAQAPALDPHPDLICHGPLPHPALGIEAFGRRWRAACDLVALGVLDVTTEWDDTDPTPPHGLPRP